MFKKIALALLVILVLIQIFSIDKTNPPTDAGLDFMEDASLPDDITLALEEACNDCHSNHTRYPWYTSVEPVSWWIKGHIDHAREALNFSEWNSYSREDKVHILREAAEMVDERSMPPKSYTMMHKGAKMNKEQKERLRDFFLMKADLLIEE